MELTPSPLDQPVALRSGDPRVCLANERFGVVGPGQDHSGKEFNPFRGFLCGGSCHGQSGSVLSR